jgi:hypothetical protein
MNKLDTVDLPGLLATVHGDLAAAVAQPDRHGHSIQVSRIRVRMGRVRDGAQSDSPFLDTERYPAAAGGWLIDAMFVPGSGPGIGALAPDAPGFPSLGLSPDLAVSSLEGVGAVRGAILQRLGVTTLGALIEASTQESVALVDALGRKALRRLSALARLATAPPPVSLPAAMVEHSVDALLHQPKRLLAEWFSDRQAEMVVQWLTMLEIALDDALLKRTKLKRLLTEPPRQP